MKKTLILGAGLWQTPFIQKAKSMGLFVYATDWDSNPKGKVFADVFEQIDVRDKNKSLDFAQKHKVDAVFTNSDVGVPTAAYIAEKLSLPFHTQELADIATNKYLMRNALKKIGLKTPYYKQCSSLREIEDAVNTVDKKLIIKPIDNCGSRGVFVLSNTDNLKQIADNAFSNSFSGKVLILLENLLSLSLAAMYSFSDKPLKLTIKLGIITLMVSTCFIVYKIVLNLFYGQVLIGWSSIIVSLFFLHRPNYYCFRNDRTICRTYF